MTSTSITIEERARAAVGRVLDLVFGHGEPVVIVNSPPGAGKTRLVEDLAATGVELGLRVAVVAPRAEQAFDIVRRLVRDFRPMPLQLLKAQSRTVPADVASFVGLRVVSSADGLAGGPGVMIGTAAKVFLAVPQLEDKHFDLLICDEAYQLAYKDFVALLTVADQVVLVGDPGQLPPLVQVDTARFEAAPYRVHWPVPKELGRRFPNAPVIGLPMSRRLPQDTVDVVQPGFYPSLPFASIAGDDRRIRLRAKGAGDPIDRALDELADGASLVGVVLPPIGLLPAAIDDGVASVVAEIAHRLIARGAEWRGQKRIDPGDIGCVDPHVASGAAIRRSLQQRGLSTNDVMVDTPEVWQGLERPFMVVKHPLSGVRRFDEFSLEPGRFCVMLSRHKLGCVVVARDGIGAALDRHQHDCGKRPLEAENAEWAGWRAHSRIWAGLEGANRLFGL